MLNKHDNRSPSALKTRSPINRLVANTASMLSSDTITRFATFLLYVLVGRYLGTQSFGRMSLALTILATFQVLASAGLRMLIIREVASDCSKTISYLINGSLVVSIFSLISLSALFLLDLLAAYSSATSEIILLFGLSLAPFALSTVCEAVFQAWQRMEYIVLVNLPRNVLVVGLTFWLLSAGYDLKAIGVLLLISNCLMLGIEWCIILRYISMPIIRPSLKTSVAMVRASFPIMSFQAILAITGSVIYVILSITMSETEVGLFNAATQVMAPVVLIFESIAIATFPMSCQRYTISVPALKRISDRLIDLVLSIALPAAIGLIALGEKLLILMYSQQEFARSHDILNIMAASLLMSALSAVFGKVLLASLREEVLLRIIVIRCLASIILSFGLIIAFGLIGAAISFLLISVLDAVLHFLQVSRLYQKPIPLQGLWRTTLATVGMLVYLLIKPDLGVVFDVFSSGIIYAVLWLILSVWSAGNVSKFKASYSDL